MNKIILGALCLMALTVQAQEWTDCGLDHPRKAIKAFEKAEESFEKGDFTVARNLYLEAYREDPKYPQVLYRLGNYAYNADDFGAAEKYYRSILEICPDFDPDLHYKIGKIAAQRKDFQGVVEAQRRYLAAPESKTSARKRADAQEDLDRFLPIYELVENPVPFEPKLVSGISSEKDEYLAIISPDGKNALYTRRFTKKGRNELIPKTVEEFSASIKKDGIWTNGQALEYPFNTSLNVGGPSITADNKTLYFTVCTDLGKGKRNCDIFFTKVESGYWSKIEPMPDFINGEKTWESQPSVSADGKVLYFVSSREGGEGGLDIWKTEKNDDGGWTQPLNLGPTINTPGDEKSPFIHSDSQTLYFASTGHYGIGGYDVFYSRGKEGKWMDPVNIGIPINTPEDELGIFVNLKGDRAYFASNKMNGAGGWDIYGFDLYQDARPEEMFLFAGKIDVEEDAGLYNAKIEMVNLETNEAAQIQVDSSSGEFLAVMSKNKGSDYLLTVNQEGFAFSGTHIDLNQADEDGLVKENLELGRIDVGKEYPLNNIKFKTNEYVLLPGSKAVVNGFADFLKANPKLRVTIEGHTDNVGSPADNLKLSQQRAEAVQNYLIELGISASRLKAKGFGESKPVAANLTEEGRAENRRTVFRIDQK